jgi:hypothetical protein
MAVPDRQRAHPAKVFFLIIAMCRAALCRRSIII